MRQCWVRTACRWAAVALGVAAISLTGAAAAYGGTALTAPTTVQAVVIAVPGLSWTDLSPSGTPALWAFAERGSRGLLAVKAAHDTATCAAAMTTLGAGNRAVGTPATERVCPTAGAITHDDWAALRRANRHQRFGTRPGALARALAVRGTTRAEGGAGALLAATDGNGVLGTGRLALTVIEDAGVYDVRGAARRAALTALDTRLSQRLRSESATLVLVVGAGDRAHGKPGLRVALAAGPGFDGGGLTSDSTQRAPYVELIDVGPTVLSALRVPIPSEMAGRPWQRTAGAPATADLIDRTDRASHRYQLGGWFVDLLVGAAVLTVVAALFALRRRWDRARRVVEVCCYLVAAAPVAAYATNGLPWWRWPVAVTALVIAALTGAVGVAAVVSARRHPPWGGVAVVSTVTALVLAADFVTGTQLQLDGLLGDSTVVAGRFRGAGNTAFAVFATSLLLLIGCLCDVVARRGRRFVVGCAIALGAAAVVLDGLPAFGDDLGGVLALVPALAVLVVLAARLPVDRRVWTAAIAAAVIAPLGVVGYDLVAGHGHVGRFARDSGGGIRTTMDRRLAAMLHSWHSSVYVVLVIVAVVAIVVLARQSAMRGALLDRAGMRAGLIAAAVCAAIGGVVNDSGAVVTGAAAVVGTTLALAGILRAQTRLG